MKTIILLFCSIFLALLFIEFGLSQFYPQGTVKHVYRNNPPIFESSDIFPYRLKPNSKGRMKTSEFDTSITINAFGYRNKPFHKEKTNLRILAVGDSFTFGHGVNDDETYAHLLDVLLGHKAEVLNAGYASCFYPDTYYLYLKEEGLELNPDIILLGLFIGNDLDYPGLGNNVWVNIDDKGLPLKIRETTSVVDNNYWVQRKRRLRYRVPVLRHSHLFQLLFSRISPFFPKQKKGMSTKGDRKEWFEASINIYRKEYPERTVNAFEKVKTLILAINSMSKKQGSLIIPVMIPDLLQVYEKGRPANITSRDDLDLDKPQRLLSDFFKKNNIRYIDLLPALRANAAGPLIYYMNDQHFTPDGHRLASLVIAKYLYDNDLLTR